MYRRAVPILLLLALVSGCATQTQTGAAIGAASGAAIGAGVGTFVNSSAGAGALIGAGLGTVSGAIIGNEMDEQDRRRDQELKDRAASETPDPASYTANRRVTSKNVIEWSRHGVPQQVIIDRIERSETRFSLSAAEENQLRENGVSEDIVLAMKQTAQR